MTSCSSAQDPDVCSGKDHVESTDPGYENLPVANQHEQVSHISK